MDQHFFAFDELHRSLGDLLVRTTGTPPTALTGAEADSRRIEPGAAFVAIRGEKLDGARFAPGAWERGAAVVLAESPRPEGVDCCWMQVTNAYAAAARAAELAYQRPARGMRLIGITGTNGKTTSAYLLDEILRAAGRRTGMVGTVEYRLGGRTLPADRTTPPPFQLQELLAEMRDSQVQDVVLEVSSHALVQRRLGTAAVDAALFTNLTGDHLDYHGTMEEYFHAKRILFDEYLTPDGPAVINVDDPFGARLAEALAQAGRTVVRVGAAGESDCRMTDSESTVQGSRMILEYDGTGLELVSPMIGRHNLANTAGVAAVALALGIPRETIAATVRSCEGAPGRLQLIRAPNGASVFVDYAHTDDALRNVLRALKQLSPSRLCVVFGCGGDRDRTKRPRMAQAAAEFADRIYATSDNPRTEDPERILDDLCAGFPDNTRYKRISDRREAIRHALADAEPGEIVLVAGKGHETYQEIDGVKHPFDDVCEVRKSLHAICGGSVRA